MIDKLMYKIIIPVFVFFLSLPHFSKGQNTVSPYSVFGPGEIQSRGFSVNTGMGDAGIALKSGNYINNLNPASYTGMDSLQILSEFGIAGKAYSLGTSNETQNGFTGNLSHIGLGFRYTNWLAGSFGVVPFSTINYDILKKNYVQGTTSEYYSNYTGSGGISQFYFGNAVRIGKHLSLGMNMSFMFGTLMQEENVIGTSLVPTLLITRNDYLRSLYFDFGLQYSFKTAQNEFSFGLTFAPSQDLKSKHYLTVYDNSNSIIEEQESKGYYLTVPNIAGIGLAMEKPGKYKIALDYNFQDWSEVNYPTQSGDFVDLHRVALGAEFMPWKFSVMNPNYKNWTYRFGVNYTRSYLKLGGAPIDKKSMTLGVGIPLPGHISNINFSLTGGWSGTKANNLVEEKFILMNVGFSLNELAFIRRKFD